MSDGTCRKLSLSPRMPVLAHHQHPFLLVERDPGRDLRVSDRLPLRHGPVRCPRQHPWAGSQARLSGRASSEVASHSEASAKQCAVDPKTFERYVDVKPELIQKAVDTLITMDLIGHSQSRNYEWALLVAGACDLVDSVWSVQNDGHRVVITTPEGGAIEPQLRRRADQPFTIGHDVFASFPKDRTSATPVGRSAARAAAPATDSPAQEAAHEMAAPT